MKFRIAATLLGAFFCFNANAAEYDITVHADANLVSDLSYTTTVLLNANDGDPLGGSVRRVVMGTAGELAILAEARLSADNLLTLDDSNTVAVIAGDAIVVKPDYCMIDSVGNATCLELVMDCGNGNNCSASYVYVKIYYADGTANIVRTADVPPTTALAVPHGVSGIGGPAGPPITAPPSGGKKGLCLACHSIEKK